MTPTYKPRLYSYVRFSTPEQAKSGVSLARQTDLSAAYAKEHGYILDDTLTMRDLGKSAFHGEHIGPTGALGAFLQAIRDGRVKKGDVLCCESLDRLSRQQISKATSQFLEIISAGVKIVTLTDNQEYTNESVNNNIGSIMMSIVIMSRSHEESLMKSRRLLDSWKRRRENIEETKDVLNKSLCGWLKLSEDKKSYKVIKEHADVIKRIFDMTKDGYGVGVIVKTLNKEKVKNWGHKPYFSTTGVSSLLKSRQVLGEYQMMKSEGKELVPVGAPIKDYYPRIITDKLYAEAWKARVSRKRSGGRTGPVMTSLLTGIGRCGYCGGTMTVTSSPERTNPVKYLVCSNDKRATKPCTGRSYPHAELERHFLTYLKELNFSKLGTESVKDLAEGKISALEVKLEHITKSIERLTIATMEGKAPKSFAAAVVKLEAEQETVIKQLQQATDELAALQDDKLSEVKSVIEDMGNYQGKELLAFRFRLREAIKKVVERVDLFAVGENNIKEATIVNRKDRFFLISLKQSVFDQHKRVVYPNVENPELPPYVADMEAVGVGKDGKGAGTVTIREAPHVRKAQRKK